MEDKRQDEKVKKDKNVVLYRYMPWDAFEKTISSWSLKVTLASDTNDYFEFFPAASKEPELDDFAKNYTRENGTFLCFTTKMSNCAMWGNYADHFKGVCMAFLFPRTESLKKVVYQSERINVGDINDHNKGEVMHRLLSTKDITWEYENEYRRIYDKSEDCITRDGMSFVCKPMKYFSGVILGTKCPYTIGHVKVLIKYHLEERGIRNFLYRNMDSVITASEIAPSTFCIKSKLWHDDMTGEHLREKGYIL